MKIAIAYIKVGRSLFPVTFFALYAAFFFFRFLFRNYEEINIFFASGIYLIAMFFLNIAFFSQLDIRSRYQNYKKVRDSLYLYGFRERILDPFAKSKCQRDAVIAASEDIGMKREVEDYYNCLGYRWYHVVPDFVKANPLFFVNKNFWYSTFFIPTYRPKYVNVNITGIKIINT